MFSDIDECDQNLHNCSENAICTNFDSNYTCDCDDGWEGSGFECSSKLMSTMCVE